MSYQCFIYICRKIIGLGTDYIPFSYAKLINDSGQTTTVPYKNRRINFQFGTVFTFGERKLFGVFL